MRPSCVVVLCGLGLLVACGGKIQDESAERGAATNDDPTTSAEADREGTPEDVTQRACRAHQVYLARCIPGCTGFESACTNGPSLDSEAAQAARIRCRDTQPCPATASGLPDFTSCWREALLSAPRTAAQRAAAAAYCARCEASEPSCETRFFDEVVSAGWPLGGLALIYSDTVVEAIDRACNEPDAACGSAYASCADGVYMKLATKRGFGFCE